MSDFDDIARELHLTRAEPRAEFARELDRRASEWLSDGGRWRLPSLRIAIPAAVAAGLTAVAVALIVSGGSGGGGTGLDVAIVPDQGAAEAFGAPLDRGAARGPEGGFAKPTETRIAQGEPVTVRYFVTAPVEGTVEFAGHEADVKIAAGSGRLEISTDGIARGAHELRIAIPPLRPSRQRIEVGG